MLRTERPGDMLPVYELVSAAFGRPDEAELVNRLRECGAAVVTMVEEEEYEFMGHLMLSPITIDGQEGPWLGLAPVAVHPDWQGQGIGSDLVREGLDTALEMDWKAVVVLGIHNRGNDVTAECGTDLIQQVLVNLAFLLVFVVADFQ